MNRFKFIIAFVSVISTMTVPHPTSGQIPDGWEIVEITNTPILFDGDPDINDRGQIVFTGSVGSSVSDREIFVYDRGRLIQITDDDTWDSSASINNHGMLVWGRDLHGDGNLSIVQWEKGKLRVLSDTSLNEAGPDINDAGHVVWQGEAGDAPEEADIFLFDGVSTQTLIDDAFAHQAPRINNNGQVIWTRCDFSGDESDILLYDAGNIRPLSDAQTDCNLANINDALQVIWTDAQFRLQMWEKENITQITSNISGSPRINDDGTIVFTRWDAVQQIHSIWMFDEDGINRVTIGPTSRNSRGVNNRGEIVFVWGPFLRDVGVITNPIFRADADFDGDVDLRDFAVVQNCWNAATSFGSACSEADLNADELVESQDIQILVDLLTGPNGQP